MSFSSNFEKSSHWPMHAAKAQPELPGIATLAESLGCREAATRARERQTAAALQPPRSMAPGAERGTRTAPRALVRLVVKCTALLSKSLRPVFLTNITVTHIKFICGHG